MILLLIGILSMLGMVRLRLCIMFLLEVMGENLFC